jgi:hypothetical protein
MKIRVELGMAREYGKVFGDGRRFVEYLFWRRSYPAVDTFIKKQSRRMRVTTVHIREVLRAGMYEVLLDAFLEKYEKPGVYLTVGAMPPENRKSKKVLKKVTRVCDLIEGMPR